ncbi:MAG: TlpA family protein disulfide reductase [Sulfurovaceae bacterium]|nr:TlpA family protein disulfide reductase [Sulfurovaceae bacterium]
MMRLLILTLFLSSLLFSYQKGDTINMDMQNKLNIKEDKIYIIDFFASWCNSCKKEIPIISKANQKIDSQKVEIIGIDVDKDIEKAKSFQTELKSKNALTYRVINDPQNSIIEAFNPIGMPALFYIQNNKVVGVIYGAVDNIDEVILDNLKSLQK